MEYQMWKYKNELFTEEMIEGYVGFVYLIYNHDTDKYYVGKKLFTKSKSYQKNKKRKKRRVSSDWMEYTGSNKILNEDVSNGHTITKTILHLCKSRGWMSYYETFEILSRNAITDDQYYNEWVSCKIQRRHLI